MKYFIKIKNGYEVMTFQKYQQLRVTNEQFRSKHFIRFGDNLLEVDQDFYKAFNQMDNRYHYIEYLKRQNEKPMTDNDESMLVSLEKKDNLDILLEKERRQKLYRAINKLLSNEKNLVDQLYFLK